MNVTVVPVLSFSHSPITVNFWVVFPPFSNLHSCILPSLYTVTVTHFDKAFTTDAPTPCNPPDTLYPPPPNLPPACKTVYTVSTVEIPVLACTPTGIPLPLSFTVIELSLFITISILLQ